MSSLLDCIGFKIIQLISQTLQSLSLFQRILRLILYLLHSLRSFLVIASSKIWAYIHGHPSMFLFWFRLNLQEKYQKYRPSGEGGTTKILLPPTPSLTMSHVISDPVDGQRASKTIKISPAALENQ